MDIETEIKKFKKCSLGGEGECTITALAHLTHQCRPKLSIENYYEDLLKVFLFTTHNRGFKGDGYRKVYELVYSMFGLNPVHFLMRKKPLQIVEKYGDCIIVLDNHVFPIVKSVMIDDRRNWKRSREKTRTAYVFSWKHTKYCPSDHPPTPQHLRHDFR